MSGAVGSPIETSLIQAAQAQQVAGKARAREKSEEASRRPSGDLVELRVMGVEAADAVRRLPQNDSEQADEEQRSGEGRETPGGPGGHVDVRA